MKLVILDRDGVINEDSDAYIKSAAEWLPIPGSLEAIVRLKHAGYSVVIASNQSGIGRGLFDYAALFAIHDKMHRMLVELGADLDGIFFCPHAPRDDCNCRKPRSGLLQSISRRFNVPLEGVPLIGDSDSDMAAARRVNALPIRVMTGKSSSIEPVADASVAQFPDLAGAVSALLAGQVG